MKQDLYSNECILAEYQSPEINLKAYREELCLHSYKGSFHHQGR